jgi:hypothetical protein
MPTLQQVFAPEAKLCPLVVNLVPVGDLCLIVGNIHPLFQPWSQVVNILCSVEEWRGKTKGYSHLGAIFTPQDQSSPQGAIVKTGLLSHWFMGHLHNPTNICENCVVRHLKVLYDKNRIDPMCENCAVRHNLWDCVNRPLPGEWHGRFVCPVATKGPFEVESGGRVGVDEAVLGPIL